MLPQLRRCSRWAPCRSNLPIRISLPRNHYRVGLHIGIFEDCSAFTCVAACTLARSPIRDRYPGASDILSPPCLPRLLPAGAVAGRGLHPLESAALSRRTRTTANTAQREYWNTIAGPRCVGLEGFVEPR